MTVINSLFYLAYAFWKDAIPVTYDANGGAFDDGQATRVINFASGERLGKGAYIPEKEGVHFFGWAAAPDAAISDVDMKTYVVTKPITVYAVWHEYAIATFHFDEEDPDWTNEAVQIKGEAMTGSADYQGPYTSDRVFDYWSTGGFGGTRVNLGTYVIKEDTDFYANYKMVYRVYLNAEDGYFATPSEDFYECVALQGQKLSNVPSDTPTSNNKNKEFAGWVDDEGSKFTADLSTFVPKYSMDLYAVYKDKPAEQPAPKPTATPTPTPTLTPTPTPTAIPTPPPTGADGTALGKGASAAAAAKAITTANSDEGPSGSKFEELLPGSRKRPRILFPSSGTKSAARRNMSSIATSAAKTTSSRRSAAPSPRASR